MPARVPCFAVARFVVAHVLKAQIAPQAISHRAPRLNCCPGAGKLFSRAVRLTTAETTTSSLHVQVDQKEDVGGAGFKVNLRKSLLGLLTCTRAMRSLTRLTFAVLQKPAGLPRKGALGVFFQDLILVVLL